MGRHLPSFLEESYDKPRDSLLKADITTLQRSTVLFKAGFSSSRAYEEEI